jgi:uncharacterized protein with NRDE domain
MCLAVLALAAHPRHEVVIVANRDEYHDRPAAAAYWWDEGWLAGRDLEAGGTWLGVTRTGRYALLTNIREPARHDPSAPTRGTLVTRFLAEGRPSGVALRALVADGAKLNGFNLVGGVGRDAWWGTNREGTSRALAPGLHGLSNHLLDTPWPKVVRTKAAVAAWCTEDRKGDEGIEALFAILADASIAPDADLPSTGVALERERMLSAAFIVSPTYGTRCSTVVTMGRDGGARFVERRFDPDGKQTGEAAFEFEMTFERQRATVS